jgi:hypothetical protein
MATSVWLPAVIFVHAVLGQTDSSVVLVHRPVMMSEK